MPQTDATDPLAYGPLKRALKEDVMTPLAFMVAAAKATIENLTPADLAGELTHPDVLLVDVRESDETDNGIIPGAVLVPRGMLEFRADHGTAYHIEGFEPRRRVIVYCAAGSRSALAVRSLQELGYHDVAHLEGGFKAWVDDGRPVTPLDRTD
jgi:rhodanese-related sulfurtransferase